MLDVRGFSWRRATHRRHLSQLKRLKRFKLFLSPPPPPSLLHLLDSSSLFFISILTNGIANAGHCRIVWFIFVFFPFPRLILALLSPLKHCSFSYLSLWCACVCVVVVVVIVIVDLFIYLLDFLVLGC